MNAPLDHIGGVLCLDFANTVGPRHSRPDKDAHDYLGSYHDLTQWSQDAGVIGANRASLLRRNAIHYPTDADTALARAVHLREAIFTVFSAIARGDEPSPAALTTIQREYAASMNDAQLISTESGIDWFWTNPTDYNYVLGPVARSAVETALQADFNRIRSCPGHGGSCGWLFYDTSKNGSRRWCSMSACGTWEKGNRSSGRTRRSLTPRTTESN